MKKFIKNADWIVLIVSLALFIIGCFALYSATQTTELQEFKKQLMWFVISIPFLILVIILDYNLIIKFSPLLYLIGIGLLIGVLFTAPISGASSWIKIGDSFSFQPSEFAKVFTILFLSFVLNKLQIRGRNEINKPWKLLIFFMFLAIPVLLIIKEPDYGTAMAFITAMLFMLFASGIDKKYIIVSFLLIAVLAVPVYNRLPEHAKARVEAFIHPENDLRGSGYNAYQSKLAIGAGEFIGMGWLQGNQTQLGYLHPKSTDFIFSVIGEEFGFMMTTTIVILYIVLITRSLYIAKTAKDNVGAYIATGIAGMFAFYMIENIGMTIGIMPITGVPLPFVSYGGTSLITNFLCIGFLINISSKRQKAIFME